MKTMEVIEVRRVCRLVVEQSCELAGKAPRTGMNASNAEDKHEFTVNGISLE